MTLPRIEIAVDPAARAWVAWHDVTLLPWTAELADEEYDRLTDLLCEAFRAGALWATEQTSPR